MPVIVFSLSLFLSAALLFLVEPMLAKMMLPRLGGTPAVWNTCLVFFQFMLLAGYLYAHGAATWLTRKMQILIQCGVVALPLLAVGFFPLHLQAGWDPPSESNPVGWILAMLTVSVGLPFFALASNSPVMQKWFTDSRHANSSDPYFLYAASNVGSLAGLLAYPLLLEPTLRLSMQSRLWTIGYLLFACVTGACALRTYRSPSARMPEHFSRKDVDRPQISSRGRLRWIALAFVPSSLMLGVTTALTTDMPAIPLLWVLPLALYLISFVLVFARRQFISHEWMIRRLPFLILAAIIPIISETRFPIIVYILLNLLLLWAVAMVCHGELARGRPPAGSLTEFYLWISLGGVLGGIFNSLIAPVIFDSVVEFPLVLIFAALLRPAIDVKPSSGSKLVWASRKDVILPLALGLCMLGIFETLAHLHIVPGRPLTILIFGYSAVWCLSFGKRPLRFAAGVAAMLLASLLYVGPFGNIVLTHRSFFGVLRVANDSSGKFRTLIHGGTIHGIQSLDPSKSREPLAYYTRSGPAADIMGAVQGRSPQGNWAIVGLGAGAMACYLQHGQTLTYFEINPLVARIAENPKYFSFLEQCAPQAKVVLGDARLELRDMPDAGYGLIVLDAFSGDSIPMHLLTREALALYLRKLAPGGLIAFHISNMYVELAPTLGTLAQDAHLACYLANDTNLSQAEAEQGKMASRWVVRAKDQTDLAALLRQNQVHVRWSRVQARTGAVVWSDDYSNLLSVIKWH